MQVGVKKAHELAHQHSLPLVPVHHMEAHALVARMGKDGQFPFLCMLVSGGHNMLLVAHAVGDYTLMGATLDDSVGMHPADYDKCAPVVNIFPNIFLAFAKQLFTCFCHATTVGKPDKVLCSITCLSALLLYRLTHCKKVTGKS